MRDEIKQLLQELPRTSHGQALLVYLQDMYKEISDVSDVVTLEDAKAKQIALKLIKKIFSFYPTDTPLGKNERTRYT